MKCFITTFLLTLSNIVSAQIYELNYNVKFGFVKCADVTVKVFDNKNYTQISAAAKSCGLADFFVEVDEKYDCFIDKFNDYLPYRIEKFSKSGDSLVNINLDFNQKNNIVTNSVLGDFSINPYTYDFLSGLLLISDSTFWGDNTEKQINIFFDNTPCLLNIKNCGNNRINNFDCKLLELKVKNLSPNNKSNKFITLIPSDSTHYLWLANEHPSYLVLAKINLVVGSLKMELRK